MGQGDYTAELPVKLFRFTIVFNYQYKYFGVLLHSPK